MDEPKEVRICLRCGSTDISVNFADTTETQDSDRMKCNACGFQNDYFPRVDKDEVASFQAVIKKVREGD